MIRMLLSNYSNNLKITLFAMIASFAFVACNNKDQKEKVIQKEVVKPSIPISVICVSNRCCSCI